jgi:hypothetical protein
LRLYSQNLYKEDIFLLDSKNIDVRVRTRKNKKMKRNTAKRMQMIKRGGKEDKGDEGKEIAM